MEALHMLKKMLKTALCISLACWLVVAPAYAYYYNSQYCDEGIVSTRDIGEDDHGGD